MTVPPPEPTADDRLHALALIRALARERPDEAAAVGWREDREGQVGMAGLGYAALFVRQVAMLMRASGDRTATPDEVLDALIEAAVRPQRKRRPPA